MKKIILSSIICLFVFISYGQTIYADYIDGAIWVKLKNESIQKHEVSLGKGLLNTNKIDITKYPFYSQISAYKIKSAEVSFPLANDPLLKNIIRIEFSEIDKVDEFINTLQRNEMVDYAERIPYIKRTVVPNDTYYLPNYQWSLFTVNAENAWNVSVGSSSVTVAIVDDAVLTTHSDLSSVIYTNTGEIPNNGIDDDNNGYIDDVNGFDVANMDNNPNPDGPSYDHGTHVAGIAGAATDNNLGVASIGSGISIIPVKSTNSSTSVSHAYEGIYYAVAANADVINMSWGSSGYSTTAQNIINYAYNSGAVLIAAAGNDNVSTVFYPAGYTNVISVASTNSYDGKSNFSNYGSWIDVSAPGSSILSTVVGGGYNYKSGTSMASPMVAGLAGLMLSHNPGLTQTQVKDCILNTATSISTLNPSYIGQLGSGRINALAAMNCVDALSNNPPNTNFTASSTTVLEGQSTTFTDLTTGNPTSWNWSFTGGTPATYSGQFPPAITYSTAGTYDVSLTTSNVNGSDTETKTAYINVNSLTGCDTITNILSTDAISIYSWGAGNGAMFGHNYLMPQYVAEKYTSYGPTYVMGASFYFTDAYASSPSQKITVKVWEGTAGNPGNEVYSQDVFVEDIEPNITATGFYPTNITFDQPVSVTTGDFFIGFELYYTSAEIVELASSGNFATDISRSNSAYYYVNPAVNPQNITTGWFEVGDIISNPFELAMHIYPRITSNPPLANITASSTSVCAGETVQFNGTSSQNLSSFNWDINGTATPHPTTISPTVLMNTVGSQMAYLTVQNSCGFEHTDSLLINIDPLPVVSVSTTQSLICPSGSANLFASGASSYTWTPSAGLSCTNCPNPIASPLSTTTYSVEGSNGTCSAIQSITIQVDNSQLDAEFTMNSNTICVGETVSVDASNSTGAQSYNWTFNGGTPVSTTGVISSSTFNSSGNHWIVLEIGNSCGVNHKDSLEVTVLPAPSVVLNASQSTICPSGSANLTASGASSYIWSPATGLSCTTCPNPVASPTSTTTYTVEGSNGTCSSTENITITVDNSPLLANLSLSMDSVCVGGTVGVDGSNSTGAQTYNWTFNGGSPSSGTGATSSSTFNTSGNYMVVLEVTNSCNLSHKDSLELSVLSFPIVTASASETVICSTESTSLTATGASSYVWTPSASLSCSTCPNPVASPATTTTYTVEGSNGVCSSTETIVITVDNPPLLANLNLTIDSVCVGGTVGVDGSNSIGAQNYNWTFNGGTPSSGTGVTSSSTFNTSGNYMIVLEVTNSCNMSHKDSLELKVLSSPNLVVSASETSICPTESTSLIATGANTYVWSPSASLSCSTCPDPVATPIATTTYSVEGSNGICNSIGSITITVDNPSVIASFTLDSDTVCVMENVGVNGASSIGAQTYNWTFNGGTPNLGSGVTSSTLYNASGTYSVELEVENICGNTDVTAKNIVVIPENECTSSLINIENGKIHIFYGSEEDNIVVKTPIKGDAFVLNSAGQKVISSKAISVGEGYIDTKSLSKGMYIVVFNTKDGKLKTAKFVK